VIDSLLEVYLAHPDLHNIEALLLACTHYPVVKDRILQHYKNKNHPPVEIIDSSDIVAQVVKHQLEKNNLLNPHGASTKHFYVSDYTQSFEKNAKLFFGEDIKLEHYPLWD